MLSNEQIRRESLSRFYLSQRSDEEKDMLMMEILERFSEPGNRFPPERMDELYLLIRKLRDCAYIGCGVDGALDETYRTTDSGMAYLRSLRKVIGRCRSGDGFSASIRVSDRSSSRSCPSARSPDSSTNMT